MATFRDGYQLFMGTFKPHVDNILQCCQTFFRLGKRAYFLVNTTICSSQFILICQLQSTRIQVSVIINHILFSHTIMAEETD